MEPSLAPSVRPFVKMALSDTDGKGIVTLGASRSNSVVWYTDNFGVSWRPAGTTVDGRTYRWPVYNPDNKRFYALTYSSPGNGPMVWISGVNSPDTGTPNNTNLPNITMRGLVYNTYDNHFYAPGNCGTNVTYRSADCLSWVEERLSSVFCTNWMDYTGDQ